jgi:hypothetical protein
MGQGAYVDMGYVFPYNASKIPIVTPGKSWTLPWFAEPRGLSDIYGKILSPGFCVYDTWSFSYENNGIDEDHDSGATAAVDEGVDGFDGPGEYPNPMWPTTGSRTITDIRLGPDDVGERETTPPYDKPLRGMQVLIRTFEPDSRAIRQVRVNQHFLQE